MTHPPHPLILSKLVIKTHTWRRNGFLAFSRPWHVTNRWLGLPLGLISRKGPGFDPSERYGVGTASF